MKLAEALILRGDIQKRLAQLKDRFQRSSMVQEGDKPHEEPARLRREIAALIEQLQTLVVQINQANITTRLASGITLTEALAQRDALTLHQTILRSVADTASEPAGRYSAAEIRHVATVDVAELRSEVDDLAKRRRELDTLIQATNWATDLPE